ncbi:kinase-like domain-containing protein [Pelagophyceae sp. CCMP2097]|nr:kinase-like domain-containing protein [Pelagophyceae sp. CCMP2097]
MLAARLRRASSAGPRRAFADDFEEVGFCEWPSNAPLPDGPPPSNAMHMSYGNNGCVRLARSRAGGLAVLKRVPLDRGPSARREVDALLALAGQSNIVIMLQHDFDRLSGVATLALQHAAGGNVGQWLRKHGPVRCGEVKLVAGHLLCALAHCHEVGFCHRDVSIDNLLISQNGARLLLADFGAAVPLNPPRARTLAVCALWNRPPELIEEVLRPAGGGEWYDGAAVDCWAAGCVIVQVARGGLALLRGAHEKDQLVLIRALRLDDDALFEGAPRCERHALARRGYGSSGDAASLVRCLRGLLRLDAARRATAAEALAEAWFADNPKPCCLRGFGIEGTAKGLGGDTGDPGLWHDGA